MEETVSATRVSLARGGSLVAPALLLANLVSYVLTVVAARQLNHSLYGELGAYLGVLLVAVVPAVALQAVVAKHVAASPTASARPLLQRSAEIGLVLTLALAVLSPAVAAFLHSDIPAALWMAVQLAPYALMSAAMGVLQGRERFGALAVVISVQSVGRALGIVPLLFGGGVSSVLLALAVGTTLTAVVAVILVQPVPGTASLPTLREIGTATSGLLAVLLIANLDVLLARNVLSGGQSGRYSAGAVLAKAAFWLPQAVAVVVFPRLSDPLAGKALLRRSVAVVAALGGLEVLGCLLLARPVLRLTFGPSYASLSSIAWLWVIQGAALSVVQLLVYRAIATHDHVVARIIFGAALVETVLVLALSPSTPGPVIAISTAVAGVLTAGLLARSAR